MARLANPLEMFIWIGVIFGVAAGRPRELALLLRAFVSIGYLFAALSKINPSFLGGEQLLGLARDREQLSSLVPLLSGDVGVAASVAVVVAELGFAVGLWFRVTRLPTMVVAICAHVGFVIGAHYGTPWDIAFLTVLNGLFIACFPAFFAPVRPDLSPSVPGRTAPV